VSLTLVVDQLSEAIMRTSTSVDDRTAAGGEAVNQCCGAQVDTPAPVIIPARWATTVSDPPLGE
jgi:hypothetical protein